MKSKEQIAAAVSMVERFLPRATTSNHFHAMFAISILEWVMETKPSRLNFQEFLDMLRIGEGRLAALDNKN